MKFKFSLQRVLNLREQEAESAKIKVEFTKKILSELKSLLIEQRNIYFDDRDKLNVCVRNSEQEDIPIYQASLDIAQNKMMEIIRNAPDHFTLLAGDDALALPIIACGGKGVVSVISNVIPLEFGNSIRMALNGNYAEAREQHLYYLSLMKACFIESNPIPAKTLLAEMGLLQDNFRLPLTQIQNQNRQKLQEIKNRYNL